MWVYNGPCRVNPLAEDIKPDNTADEGGNTTSFPIQSPPNQEVGDLLIAVVAQDTSNNASFTPPAGWTQIGSTGTDGRGSSAAFYNRIDDATEAGTTSWTFTSTLNQEWVAAIYKIAARTYDDVSAGSWLHSYIYRNTTTDFGGAQSSMACGAFSNLPARTTVIRVAFWETGSDTGVGLTWSTGTEDFEIATFNQAGASNGVMHGVVQMESSGSVADNTTDPAGASNYDGHCWSIAIKPAA